MRALAAEPLPPTGGPPSSHSPPNSAARASSCAQVLRTPCASWPAAAAPRHSPQAAAVAAAATCRAPCHAALAARAASSKGGYGANSTDSDSGYLDVCVSSSQGWLLDSASDMWDTSLTSDITSGRESGSYDAIMMLGGGLLPGGGLPEWVVRRLEGCLHLYREQAAATARGLRDDAASGPAGATVAGAAAEQQLEQDQLRRRARPWAPERPSGACPIVLLGAGTPHKPPVIDEVGASRRCGGQVWPPLLWAGQRGGSVHTSMHVCVAPTRAQGGFVLHESTAYAAYLMRRGVPAGDLLKEAQVRSRSGYSVHGACRCKCEMYAGLPASRIRQADAFTADGTCHRHVSSAYLLRCSS